MDTNWTVYMHITPNNKRYIGITSLDVEKRWRKGNGYFNHKHFFNAIKKYGWENIIHKIIFSCLSEKEAKEKEIELIAQYKTYDKNYGYNHTLGGDGRKGDFVSDEQKHKISIANRLKNAYLTEDEVFNIKVDLLNNLSYSEITKKYNIKYDNLLAIISGRNYGYIFPNFTEIYNHKKTQHRQNFEDDVIKLAQSGLSVSQISKQLNCGRRRIDSILYKNNINSFAKENNLYLKNIKSLVIEDFISGCSYNELIEKYNISLKSIKNYTNGIYTKLKKDKDNALQKEMCNLRLQGWFVKDIAKKYGCNREKVSKLTKEYAFDMKKKDIKLCYKLEDAGYTRKQIAKEINRDIDFVNNWLNKRKEGIVID